MKRKGMVLKKAYLNEKWLNLRLTDRKKVFIIDPSHLSTSRERRTIMIARNLDNNLTATNRERIVLLAACW